MDNYSKIQYNNLKKYSKHFKNSEIVINNYLKYNVNINDLIHLNKILKKDNLSIHDLNNLNSNYFRGVLPTALKLSSYNYFYNSLANILDLPIIFFNENILIIELNNMIYISYKGTNNFNEFLKNSQFIRTKISINETIIKDYNRWKEKFMSTIDFKNYIGRKKISNNFLFHSGFNKLFKNYKIIEIISKYINIYISKYKKNPDIFLIGHSLGGAFVNLTIIKLHNIYPKLKLYSITFSSPGCMNSNLSLYFLYLAYKNIVKKYIRLCSGNDIAVNFLTNYKLKSKLIGTFRHHNSAIPIKFKNSIKNIEETSNNFIIINVSKYTKDLFIDNKSKKYLLHHKLYRFSNSNKAPGFIL